MSQRLARRAFLAGLGIAGVAGLAWMGGSARGGGVVLAWIHRTIRRWLPDASIGDDEIDRFAVDYVERHAPDIKVKLYAATARFVGPLFHSTRNLSEWADHLERRLLTDFLLGGNFFQLTDPRKQAVVYVTLAQPVCHGGNPFARFVEPPTGG